MKITTLKFLERLSLWSGIFFFVLVGSLITRIFIWLLSIEITVIFSILLGYASWAFGAYFYVIRKKQEVK